MSYEYKLDKPCKLMKTSITSNGYCIKWCKSSKKSAGAHRVSYCEAHGLSLEDIEGQVVRHKCDVKNCIEPSHLELGTYSDNARDTSERGRLSHNKLTDEDVKFILDNHKPRDSLYGARALARMFGVDDKAIRCVLSGSTFRHVRRV